MKKVLKVSLIITIICMMMTVKVYGLSLNVELKPSKLEVEKGEEFTVDFLVSNIESARGINALTVTLDYSKDSLELVKIEGKNAWETPIDGVSFNKDNGKIAINKNGLGKADEVIFTITFKVINNAKQNAEISLKNIDIADGDELAKLDNVKKDITIKNESNQSATNPSTNNTNNSTNTNSNNQTNISGTNTNINSQTNISGSNSNSNLTNNKSNSNTLTNGKINDTTKSGQKIPQTGSNNTLLILAVVTGIVLAVYFGIKMKRK